MKVQQATGPVRAKARIESGPLQFPGDWPGVFIRGDSCDGWAVMLRNAARKLEKDPVAYHLHELADLLTASRERT